MHFKIDNNLRKIADFTNCITLEALSRHLCDEFVAAGLIEDEPYNYGNSVMDATRCELVRDIAANLCHALSVNRVPADVFGAFCALTLMGESNCPECGGTMELYEDDGKWQSSGDRDCPPSYESYRREYHCNCCGCKAFATGLSDVQDFDAEDENNITYEND